MTKGWPINRNRHAERIALLVLTLGACGLRLWALDSKGLDYDEAATALMARPTAAAIIRFHWEAAFEHPPVWQLLIHAWSALAGQSEYALRFLPVLAGVVQVPLIWQLAKQLAPRGRPGDKRLGNGNRALFLSLPLLSALLVALFPILLLYSQEARMYTLVVALALASLWATERLASCPSAGSVLTFALVNWMMTGLHYYSLLLVVSEGLYCLWRLIIERSPSQQWSMIGLGLALAVAPLAGWLLLAPGFHATARIVLNSTAEAQPGFWPFLDALWRDLTFGAIRWQPGPRWLGYLLLPLVFIGGGALALQSAQRLPDQAQPGPQKNDASAPPALLIALSIAVPILLSAFLFRTLATRYILFVAPLICLWIAAGIVWIGRIDWRLGSLGLAVVLFVAGVGCFYYVTFYTKSDYRAMTQALARRFSPDDGILLEAPRQHLLAKYYLPAQWHYDTAPHVDLPDFWPVNAPPVVPEDMDDRIQESLRRHPVIWLILTGEDEVDKGEFVQKYLTAVSFRAGCQDWLDVRLCRFVSPHYAQTQITTAVNLLFGNELSLERGELAMAEGGDDGRFLLVTLHWLARAKPSVDYRVTLRLVDSAGVVVSQQDDFPIGPLLPPTTWSAGDAKPGYMALTLPAGRPGHYRVMLGLYDPATEEVIAHSDDKGLSSKELVEIGAVEQGQGGQRLDWAAPSS